MHTGTGLCREGRMEQSHAGVYCWKPYILLFEEKGAVLAFSTSFFVQLCPNICQEEGEGWREWWPYSFGRHFWEHFWLQTTFFGFTKGTMSWTLMSWKILGWVPLCSYTTTIWPTGAADRVSSISSWALPASWMPTGTGERERFFALSPISCLRVNEGHLATTQSNYLKEVRSLSSFLYYSHKLHFWHHLEAGNVSNPHTSNAIDIKYLSSSPKPLGVFWALHPGKWLVRDDFSNRGSM